MFTSGRYFKIETLGAVDGPGLRLVLFLQGCPLRCPYCHNPEGWDPNGGQDITVEQVLEKLHSYKSYYRGGGITVSGGEPLMQPDFVRELFMQCAREKIHTAVDTSGCVTGKRELAAIRAADLILLDVKSPDPVAHKERFGFSLCDVKRLISFCDDEQKDIWVRHVIVPGLNDDEQNMAGLAELIKPHPCVKKVELLPFQSFCMQKYLSLGIAFPLADCEVCSDAKITGLTGLLASLLPGMTIA